MTKSGYFRLGIFILAAIALLVGFTLVLGAGTFFRKTVTMETYFDESVQGLDIGSPVKIRGVSLGRVRVITFTATRYQLDLPRAKRRPYVLVESELQPELISPQIDMDPEQMKAMLRKGLRVRLAPLGITGQAFLEVDILDGARAPDLQIDWTPDNLYIPSAPSTFNQIVNGAQTFLAKLDRLDVDTLATSLILLVDNVNRKVETLPLDSLSKDASAALREVRTLAAQMNAVVSRPEFGRAVTDLEQSVARTRQILANPSIDAATNDAAASMARLRQVLDSKELAQSLGDLNRIVARLERLSASGEGDVQSAVINLRQVMDNLRDLTELLRRYPGALFSAPPPPVVLPEKK